jgi:hypothetical protein
VKRSNAKPMQARNVPLKSEVYAVGFGCDIRVPSSLPDTGPGCGVPTRRRAVSTAHLRSLRLGLFKLALNVTVDRGDGNPPPYPTLEGLQLAFAN